MKKTNIFLLLIVTLSIFTRFFHIGSNPPSIYWDEASIGYEAYSVSQTGKDMHGNSWLQAIFPGYGDYKAPVYIWLTSLSVRVLGTSIAAIRVPSAILGVLTILVIFMISMQLFTRQKNKESISLFSALMLAISPWHIQFSRAGFEANIGLFLLSLAVYLVLKSREKPKYLILSALIASLGVYSYFSIRIIAPLILVGVVVVYRKSFKQAFGWMLASAILFYLTLIPLTRSPHYQISNQFRLSTQNILDNHDQVVYSNQLRDADGNSLLSRVIHHRYFYTAKEFLINAGDHLDPGYLFFTGDTNKRHSTGMAGIMLPFTIPLLYFGLFKASTYKKELLVLLGFWVVSLLPASIPQETPHALRSLSGVIPVSIFLGVGASFAVERLSKKSSKSLVTHLILFAIGINFCVYYYHLTTKYPQESGKNWQDGYIQVANYIKNGYQEHDHFIVKNVDDRLYLYILYFINYPPREIQASSLVHEYKVSQFGKVSLVSDITSDSMDINSIIIVRPTDIPEGFEVVDEILDSQGNVVFVSAIIKKR